MQPTRALAATATAVALLAGCAPAAAQPRPAAPVHHLWLEATGDTITGQLEVNGRAADLTSIINSQHPSAWTGDGVITIEARGPNASCRIVADGVVVDDQRGPVARCQLP